ncbi:hypothetical protein HPB52_005832 [Rhipicephalus sanguineus]|uniref:Uncharacterized protein n=1 Tax=Rhipicephalus sanguineus TaxID=34632 RepID=A0A9D4T1K1_RHISA|nr:hypothetical protein HPB52_005832 [Rhipicephalus sanguineus]
MAQPLMRALQVTAAAGILESFTSEYILRITPSRSLPLTRQPPYISSSSSNWFSKRPPTQSPLHRTAALCCARRHLASLLGGKLRSRCYKDLQTRNPDADIIAARRMGRTLSILITFAHGPVPHTIRYMSVVQQVHPSTREA